MGRKGRDEETEENEESPTASLSGSPSQSRFFAKQKSVSSVIGSPLARLRARSKEREDEQFNMDI